MFRRRFLSTTATLSLAAALSRSAKGFANTAAEKHGLGLQLWTVRNQLSADKTKTLKAIVDAGYKQIELMNISESKELVNEAKGLGLEVRSAFFNWQTVAAPELPNTESLEAQIEGAKTFGLQHMVFGYIGKANRDTADKLKRIAERANKAAEQIQAAGMKMSYHNHSFEFEKLEGGKTGFEILMNGFDPKLVDFELDVFWAAIGGWDPIETIKKLGNRLGQIHLKDLKANSGIIYDEGKVPADAFQEVGDGVIAMKEVISLASSYGVRQFHVEQDQSPGPIASIAQSAKAVGKIW
jgi:sugar phosphate isomerase/epimerase